MLLLLNLISIVLYTGSFLLADRAGITWPMSILGLALFFVVLPYTLIKTFRIRLASFLEQWGASLVIFFFGFVPLFFFLNHFAGVQLKPQSLIAVYSALFLVCAVVQGVRKEPFPPITITSDRVIKGIKGHWPFLLALGLFFVLHAVNFSFYKFIPEWDGYTDLKKIADLISTGFVTVEYRSFFIMAMGILSVAMDVDPYFIFSVVMVALQSSLLMVIYQLIRDYKITERSLQLILLLGALAVPVLTLEIDMTRPQNVVILALPLYILFLYRALKDNRIIYWVLSTLIVVAGVNYHEFFLFMFTIHGGWIIWLIFKRFFLQARDSRDKTIFGLMLVVVVLLVTHIPFMKAVFEIVSRVAQNVAKVSAWRWWFLGSYNTDGPNLNLGWPGLDGAARYYGYYVGPLALVLLLLLIVLLIRRRAVIRDRLIVTMLPLLVFFLLFAEILPRLNFVLLPERFWVLISTLLVIMMVPLVRHAYMTRTGARVVLQAGLVCLIAIGLVGSLYVAKGKKALTSQEEYVAAQWIKDNTPTNAVFISQAANGPMVDYFARRTVISPQSDYFLSSDLESIDLQSELRSLVIELNKVKDSARSETDNYLNQNTNVFTLTGQLSTIDATITQLQKQIKLQEKLLTSPVYVLYSTNKFEGLYAEREWWRLANFYGANLDKFNKKYPVVYQKDGVTIWEVK